MERRQNNEEGYLSTTGVSTGILAGAGHLRLYKSAGTTHSQARAGTGNNPTRCSNYQAGTGHDRAARNNGLDAAALCVSAEDSLAGLLALLPCPVGDAQQMDAALLAEMERLLPAFEAEVGGTKVAATVQLDGA